jgi:hypothetical protein
MSQVKAIALEQPRDRLLRYLILGILIGIVFIKSEVVSWYRIQEMFRFQSFHMFGIIGRILRKSSK